MRSRLFILLSIAIVLVSCGRKPAESKVMAREVPERADDFVFENNLIAGRIYGKALEGNPTSPGVDIWVKLPGALVADTWYAEALKDGGYYHRDHGGKDCYKVGVSLGGGASVPFIDGRLCYPPTNYRSSEILEYTPVKVVFVLHYPAWEAAEGITVSLDKKITVCADSYFCDVEDTYSFTGAETIPVAAGIKLHGEQKTIQDKYIAEDRLAIWEQASDQSVEPEDGMIGVAVIMPEATEVYLYEDLDHGLLTQEIRSGEPFRYRFGSCWSKGDIKTPEAWFALVGKVTLAQLIQ